MYAYTVKPCDHEITLGRKIVLLYPIFIISIVHTFRYQQQIAIRSYVKKMLSGCLQRASKGFSADFDGPLTSCRGDTRHKKNNKLHPCTLHRCEYATVRSVLSHGINTSACRLHSSKPLAKMRTPLTGFLDQEGTAYGSVLCRLHYYGRQSSPCCPISHSIANKVYECDHIGPPQQLVSTSHTA